MPKHFPISPSGAAIRIACPGSADLPKYDPESVYAAEGTEAHEIAGSILLGYEPEESLGGVEDLNRIEMIKAARVYTGYVDKLKAAASEHGGLLVSAIEQTLESTSVPNLGGTIDSLLIYRENGGDDPAKVVLHVVDFKYGQGVAVSPYANAQLLCYLLIARECFTRYDVTGFRATIVQPRHTANLDVQTATYTHTDLDVFRMQLINAVLGSGLKAGDHCRFCGAASYCPEVEGLTKKVLAVDLETDPVEKWVELHDAAGAIRSTLNKISGRLRDALEAGTQIDGLKLVERLGNREWLLSDDDLVDELKRRGVPKTHATHRETRVKSPREIEKYCKEIPKLSGLKFDDLTTRRVTGSSVAKATDSRPEVKSPFENEKDSEL